MTASNHAVTGALIAAVLPNPALAVPLALTSHLALDVLPHYGTEVHTNRNFFMVLGGDAFVTALVLLLILIALPSHWWLMVLCALIAVSPDVLWLPYWMAELQGITRPEGRLAHFLSRIQWGERSWGWLVEVPYFIGAFVLLLPHLSR